MGYQVFISHSSLDKDAAEGVRVALEAAGIEAWIAPRDVRHGSDFEEDIVAALGIVRVLLVILSANAASSKHVKREVALAFDGNRRILPVRLDGVDLKIAPTLYYYLASVHWFDATAGLAGPAMGLLTDAVRGWIDPAPPDSAPPVDGLSAPALPTEAAPLRMAGEGGDAAAAYQAALAYRNGTGGVRRDSGEALDWTRKAALLGHPMAQCDWGYHLQAARNLPAAIEWYGKAAEQGVREARFQLGLLLQAGRGVLVDKPRAEALFHAAARDGHRGAQFELAKLHWASGRLDSAREWARLAAEKGHESAANLLQTMNK